MTVTQQHRPIAIETPLGEDVLLLRSMSGTESLGRLFEYDLDLIHESRSGDSATQPIEVKRLLGENVTVRLETGRDTPRYFNGFITRIAQIGKDGRTTHYRATLAPWLWFLTRTTDCKIFQDMTVPQIVKSVFKAHGFDDLDDALFGQYHPRDYCVQYRETDFNFVSRLMEYEGIYYYFEHVRGKHTLVLADGAVAHEPNPGYEQVRFLQPANQSAPLGQCVHDWDVQHEVQPCVCSLNDYDFKKPRVSLSGRSQLEHGDAGPNLEVYDYPGKFREHDHGIEYARVRVEEFHSDAEVFRGESTCHGLSCGGTFELTHHPCEAYLRTYLVTSITHHLETPEFNSAGESDGPVYRCSLTAIDSKRPFRPARVTPTPVIQGPQTAIVVGKAGAEIWTDQFGRVKVQFHWDRYGKYDETSSCWVRVAHSWAGKGWGSIFIPRIGQEVIVEFLEGDPDRPIITGRVYNGCSMPPYKLPANASISTIKSNSTKGGQGFNEIRFQDEKGEEQVFIHAEKNLDTRVKNNTYEWIGTERHKIVGTDQLEQVKHDRHETVGNDHFEKITKDRHLSVGGMQAISVGGTHSLTVSGDVVEVIQGSHCHQADGSLTVKAAGVVIQSLGSLTLAAGGSSVVIDAAGVTLNGPVITLDGGFVKIASGSGSSAGGGVSASAIAPGTPTLPHEADQADPGLMNKHKQKDKQTGCGKYGPPPPPPFIPPPPGTVPPSTDTYWIEIELIDENDHPVPGEPYKIQLPDGSIATGSLDQNGFARVDGIDSGTCQVTFPNLDKDSWRRA